MPDQLVGAVAGAPAASPWMIIPFAALLLAIAIVPFIDRQWWEKYYPHVSIGLGALVFTYYCVKIDPHRMFDTLVDYFSFITLIGSLFVAAGGIFLHTERHATPIMNTGLLAVGALVSNILGTTGASMLLIRPFMRVNRPRIRGYHIVFFIFVVSNMGGALTPIGDPPLFLGYLNGVPFRWTILHLWHIWAVTLALTLGVFFVIDSRSFHQYVEHEHHRVSGSRFELLGTQNFFFLFIILAAVFTTTPAREIIMIAAAAAAHRFAKKEALRANGFTLEPIKEVAILFAGIFATMVPALDWLAENADRLGVRTPGQFYWSTGFLSGFLDNAPTYLNFLGAAMGLHHLALGNPDHMGILLERHSGLLQAISAGAVFFGAATYIGNGPNFMVRSIAEHAGVKCPSFTRYITHFTLPILIPILAVIWLLFFR